MNEEVYVFIMYVYVFIMSKIAKIKDGYKIDSQNQLGLGINAVGKALS